jgi:hypothetical protein
MYAYISTLQHGRSLSKRGVITTVGILKSNFQHSSFSKAKKDKYFILPKNSPPSKLLIQQGAVLLRSKAPHCFSFEAMRHLPLRGRVTNLACFFFFKYWNTRVFDWMVFTKHVLVYDLSEGIYAHGRLLPTRLFFLFHFCDVAAEVAIIHKTL